MNAPRVAVVGAGIAGLAAAHRLRALLGPDAAITLLEQRDRIGGVLRTVDLAGRPYDVGAEAFLARRPEVQALLAELGLVERLVHPTGAGASIRAAGRTVALPGGTVLGVPTSAARLAGLLSHAGLAAVAAEPARPLAWSPGGDAALGRLLRARFGDELTDRLVDPLLGGVYAGRVDVLGLRPTMPALAAALDAGATSLTAAADAVMPPPPSLNGESPPAAVPETETRRHENGDSPSRKRGSPLTSAKCATRRCSGGCAGATACCSTPSPTPPAPTCASARPCAPSSPARPGGCWCSVRRPRPRRSRSTRSCSPCPRPRSRGCSRPVAPAAADAAAGIELASSVVVALAFREEDVARARHVGRAGGRG